MDFLLTASTKLCSISDKSYSVLHWTQDQAALQKKFFKLLLENKMYRNNPKCWDRQAWANSVDPDQMLQNAASDLGLHCLPLIQHYFRHISR